MSLSSKTSNKIVLVIFKMFVFISSVLPNSILYFLSGLLQFVLHRVIKYRYQVINYNLKNSYPADSKTSVNINIQNYYKHLSEIILENLKMFSGFASKSFQFEYLNPEEVNKLFYEEKDCILLTGHIGNWEMGFANASDNFYHEVIGVYQKQSNEVFDKYLLNRRKQNGATLIESRKFLKHLIAHKSKAKPRIYMMIPDQRPKKAKNIRHYQFLNQETTFSPVVERIAKKYNMPILYGDVVKLRRGVYQALLIWISKTPQETPDGFITEQYVRLLERNINSDPSIWLWSHNRWLN